jgi:hypothetical protein
MTLPKLTTLFFAPTGEYVEAEIVELTEALAEKRIHRDWWSDTQLSDPLETVPIDRDWNWNEMRIEYDNKLLKSKRFAIVTGDSAAQGAMMISLEPVQSVLSPGDGALFIELLFAAPRNRPVLRRDGKPYFLGAGTQLLTWGAWLSQETGYEGRLMLDGSPDYVHWYKKRGLKNLGIDPIVFESVAYTPMELPAIEAERLLKNWK